MKIEFINHASYLLNGSSKILCDPWLDGDAFNNGWRHLIKSLHKPNDFKNIDYIWISHEHPDHFSPRFFLGIEEVYRKNITILFQYTIDKRILKFCKKLGFNVIELPLGKYYKINDRMTVLCDRVGITIDSFLFIELDGVRILNINDCILDNVKKNDRIKNIIKKVDVLFSQFSYANWLINEKQRIIAAKNKIEAIKTQLAVYKPRYFIPFASFIYFSHEENYFMNDSINSPEIIFDNFKNYENLETLIMSPGDIWEYGSDYNSNLAIEKYVKAINNTKPISNSNNVDELTLTQSCDYFLSKYSLPYWQKLVLSFIKKDKTDIFIWDLNKSFTFNYTFGIIETFKKEQECDYAMSSDSLNFIFSNSFGATTLAVNGRFKSRIANTRELAERFLSGILAGSEISFHILLFRLIRKYIKY